MPLTDDQLKAAELLAIGELSPTEIGQQLVKPVTRKTIWSWQTKNEEFKAHLETIRKAHIRLACVRAGRRSNTILGQLMSDLKHRNPSVRMQAAQRLEKWIFGDRVSLEVSGPDGAPLAAPKVVIYLPDNGRDTPKKGDAESKSKGDEGTDLHGDDPVSNAQ